MLFHYQSIDELSPFLRKKDRTSESKGEKERKSTPKREKRTILEEENTSHSSQASIGSWG